MIGPPRTTVDRPAGADAPRRSGLSDYSGFRRTIHRTCSRIFSQRNAPPDPYRSDGLRGQPATAPQSMPDGAIRGPIITRSVSPACSLTLYCPCPVVIPTRIVDIDRLVRRRAVSHRLGRRHRTWHNKPPSVPPVAFSLSGTQSAVYARSPDARDVALRFGVATFRLHAPRLGSAPNST